MNSPNFAKLACAVTVAAIFAVTMPAYSSVDGGKATYNESCIHCHGESGIGNPASDKFWKMTIPRLTGDYIQNKSNDELTSVILNGKRKMPPAMMGNPQTAHQTKVTQKQVPDLIAYIRTLKK